MKTTEKMISKIRKSLDEIVNDPELFISVYNSSFCNHYLSTDNCIKQLKEIDNKNYVRFEIRILLG